jgi:CheY-like chemotaxis protein
MNNASYTLEQSPASRRVLIVDDDADFGQSLAALLRREGHDVRCVRDGTEAVAQASCWLPELVLLDIFMPGPSGFATARELRSGCPDMPMYLVMTSAADLDETTLVNAGEAGFDRCVDKTNALPAVQEIIARELPQLSRH